MTDAWIYSREIVYILTEALGLYPFIHFTTTLSMYHPVRCDLILFSKAPLAVRRFLRSPSFLKAFKLVVPVFTVRSLPHVAFFKIADVDPLAACVRLNVRVLVLSACIKLRVILLVKYIELNWKKRTNSVKLMKNNLDAAEIMLIFLEFRLC